MFAPKPVSDQTPSPNPPSPPYPSLCPGITFDLLCPSTLKHHFDRLTLSKPGYRTRLDLGTASASLICKIALPTAAPPVHPAAPPVHPTAAPPVHAGATFGSPPRTFPAVALAPSQTQCTPISWCEQLRHYPFFWGGGWWCVVVGGISRGFLSPTLPNARRVMYYTVPRLADWSLQSNGMSNSRLSGQRQVQVRPTLVYHSLCTDA